MDATMRSRKGAKTQSTNDISFPRKKGPPSAPNSSLTRFIVAKNVFMPSLWFLQMSRKCWEHHRFSFLFFFSNMHAKKSQFIGIIATVRNKTYDFIFDGTSPHTELLFCQWKSYTMWMLCFDFTKDKRIMTIRLSSGLGKPLQPDARRLPLNT